MAGLRKWRGLSILAALALVLAVGAVAVPMAGTADNNGDKGSFDVLVFEDGNWQLQGELSFSDYETRELPLDNDAGQLSIRLVQHGHDGAYVDYVALHKDSATYLPAAAINVNSNTNVLGKVISPDYDVCDGWDSTLEIVWDSVPANATLIMRAMEEDLGIGHGAPLYYPDIHRGETLGYTLADDGGIIADGVLEEIAESDFSVFWQPDSPHPDGYTYGWLHCDKDYLYAAVEVTADNTPDEEDWGALYVMVDGASKEFRVSCDDNQWGTDGFQYTASVIYEHRIYEFRIPLDQISAHVGDEIHYGFGCYGTVTIKPHQVWVDDSWGCQADVDLFNPSLTWHYDAFSKTQEGINGVREYGTVHVRAGKYDEHLVINKSLTLQSSDGWQETTIDPVVESIIHIEGDVDVTVQGFEITGGQYGIDIANDSSAVSILDCFIHTNSGFGIHVAGVDEASGIAIQGNVISENGDDGINVGVGLLPVLGNLVIRDNIIGAWTYHPGDYGYSGPPRRYYGNGDRGIEIIQVGAEAQASGTVIIKGNKISENHHTGVPDETGIYIGSIYGVVSIEANDVGSWTDRHGASHPGNNGAGIVIANVFSGAVLTIGPDNSIKDNLGHGIDVWWGEASSDIEIHHNVIDHNSFWDLDKGIVQDFGGAYGIKLGSGGVCGAMARGNIITHHHEGVHIDVNSRNTVVENNEIRDNGHGVWIEGDNNQILHNDILNNRMLDSGIHLTSTAEGNIVHCNNIVGNLLYGVCNENPDQTVDAIANWWGDASGPSGAGSGGGDAVSENVNYSSWLPAEFQYCRECSGAPPPGVPAVNRWGIVALVTLFAGLLVWTVRRKRLAS